MVLEDRSDSVPIPHLIVGGVRVAPLSRGEICATIVRDCQGRRGGVRPGSPIRLLFSANGHALSLAARNDEFRDALEQADLVHADGQAIVFASRIFLRPGIPERSATTDLIHDLAPLCATEGLSFYLLGGTEDVNDRCAEALMRLYPGLKIAGRHHGYFAEEQEQQICEAISASGADIVWVGLGKPLEQLFCARNRERFDAGWAITCGGTFRFVIGDYRRAPRWMQAAGVEWLFRVLSNPRRLLWRYLTTNFHAVWLLAMRTRHDRGGGSCGPAEAPSSPAGTRGKAAASWYRDPRNRGTDMEDGSR